MAVIIQSLVQHPFIRDSVLDLSSQAKFDLVIQQLANAQKIYWVIWILMLGTILETLFSLIDFIKG